MKEEQVDDLDYKAYLNPELNLIYLEDHSKLYLQTFIPSPDDPYKLRSKPENKWHVLAKVYKDRIETFPVHTNPFSQRYLESKNGLFYKIVYERELDAENEIYLDDVEQEIYQLSGWNIFDDCTKGLGLNKTLRDFWASFNAFKDVDTLVIRRNHVLEKKNNEIHLSINHLDDIRRAFNRGNRNRNDRLRSAKQNYVRNTLLTHIDPVRFPEIVELKKVGSLVEMRVNRGAKTNSLEKQKERVKVIAKEISEIAVNAPRELLSLHADIERVTLSGMIDKFEKMLQKNLPEPQWQSFFEDNTFVLTMLFSRPVYLLHTQFDAKSPNITGSGAQIGDFLFGEKGRSLAIIEIKKPSTDLLKGKPYRNDVYAPDYEISGAITQVLTQKSSMQNEWITHVYKNQSLHGYHSDVIKCIVLAGKTPEDGNKIKSFNLFRNSCKDVEVITYDELLDKLKILLSHLKGRDEDKGEAEDDEEVKNLPF